MTYRINFNKTMKKSNGKSFSSQNQNELLETLATRFEENMQRHKTLKWEDVKTKLENDPEKLSVLATMEETGGEPDVIGLDKISGEYIFYDCSPESPTGRRSLCYDRKAWEARKKHKPENNVLDVAKEMGISLLTEEEYRNLQQLGKFDTKTSSWMETPVEIRKLGGAIFGDFRYGQVFIYHNGADSQTVSLLYY